MRLVASVSGSGWFGCACRWKPSATKSPNTTMGGRLPPSLEDLGAGDITLEEFSDAIPQIVEVPETGPLPLPELDEDEEEPLLPGVDDEGV